MAATSKKKAKKSTSKSKTAGKKSVKKAAASKSASKPAKKTSKKTAKKAAKKKAGKKAAGGTVGTSGKKAGKKTVPAKTKAGKKTAKKKTGKKSKKAGGSDLHTDHSVIPGIAPYEPGKNEEYMNDAQEEHFREILLAWRSQLVADITRTISSMQDESINHPDPTDRATQETDMSLELRSRDRERKLIKKIDETIQRIDDKDYGFCDNCGVEIGIARLEARPTATLCIDCKTLDEIRERQMV